jgi:hypothetical protein
LRLDVTPVFTKNYASKKRIKVNRGGTRSSKTRSIAQLSVLWLFTGQISRDRTIEKGVWSTVRKYSTTLDATVIRDFEEELDKQGLYGAVKHNKTKRTYIYGERMGKDGHVIPDIIARIKRLENNKALEVNGVSQTRSFMYIDDAIKDTIKVAESYFSNEIFNIGIEKETAIIDIVKRLLEYSGKNFEIIDKGSPLGSVDRRLPDMNKFKEFFGKSKYTSLTEGLLKTYLWYNKKE